MGSIFNRPLEQSSLHKKMIMRRQTQGMSSYFTDILGRWRWGLLSVMLVASALVIYTHKSSRTVARSLISFQAESTVQPATVGYELAGRTSLRDRHLHFVQSHEFYRLLSEAIHNDKTYSQIRKRLIEQTTNPAFGLAWASDNNVTKNQLKNKLRDMLSFTPNGDNGIMIEAESTTQKFSKDLTMAVTQFAISLIKDSQLQAIDVDRRNVESQISAIKTEIDGLNKEVLDFKQDHNLLSVQTLPDDLRNSISNLSKSLLETEIQLQENTYMLRETSQRSEETNQRILATKGVGYHDQVLESKRQDLIDQRAVLKAKAQGLKKIIEQERTRFDFMSDGEEKLGQIKVKIQSKFEQLNQLEQKQKSIESLAEQLNQSVRKQGEAFIHQTNNSLPLTLKLILLNVALFFVLGMTLYYWYEAFPVLSYRDPKIADLDLAVMPWFGSQDFISKQLDASVRAHAQRLCAQKVLKQLSGPGVHQILSANEGDGKSLLTSMLARELADRGDKVCIIDLSCEGGYEDLPSNVKVVKDPSIVHSVISNPRTSSFVSQGADWVLIDSGALNNHMGHLLVSPFMDGIIFVGSYLHTKTKSFTDWKLKIEQLAGKKAVFVLNKTDLRVDLPFLLMAPAMNQEQQTNRKAS